MRRSCRAGGTGRLTGDREAILCRRHAGQPLTHADRRRQLLAAAIAQAGLVVEQVELRRRAGLEEIDDAPRRRREVRQAGKAAMRTSWPAALSIFVQQKARAAEPRPTPV